jgi:thioredoxin reductase (NADPH)
VGGGDSACEEAVYLAKFASVVHLVHRGARLRASPIMAARALNHPKSQPIWNSTVTEVMGNDDDGVTGVRLHDHSTATTSELKTFGLFVAIGHTPKTDFLKGQLATHPATGHVLLEPPSPANGFARSRTSVEGIFAAGDVADATYRQAITAAASGCMAALDAERWLSNASVVQI